MSILVRSMTLGLGFLGVVESSLASFSPHFILRDELSSLRSPGELPKREGDGKWFAAKWESRVRESETEELFDECYEIEKLSQRVYFIHHEFRDGAKPYLMAEVTSKTSHASGREYETSMQTVDPDTNFLTMAVDCHTMYFPGSILVGGSAAVERADITCNLVTRKVCEQWANGLKPSEKEWNALFSPEEVRRARTMVNYQMSLVEVKKKDCFHDESFFSSEATPVPEMGQQLNPFASSHSRLEVLCPKGFGVEAVKASPASPEQH